MRAVILIVVAVLAGHAPGQYLQHVGGGAPQSCAAPGYVADFNNSGMVDIAYYPNPPTQIQIFSDTAVYNLTSASVIPFPAITAGWPGELKATRINGDSLTDIAMLVTHTAAPSELYVFLGQPNGNPTPPVAPWPVLGINHPMQFFDANNDGLMDIYATQTSASGQSLLTVLMNGHPIWTQSWTVPLTSASLIKAGDFDGDGNPDLAWIASGGVGNPPTSIQIAYGNGNGLFLPPVATLLGLTCTPNCAIYQFEASDLDGDGRSDLYFTPIGAGINMRVCFGEANRTLSMSGPAVPQAAGTANVAEAYYFDDVDMDGLKDCVQQDVYLLSTGGFYNFRLNVYRGLGLRTWQTTPLVTQVPPYNPFSFPSLHFLDCDADGDSDVIGTDYNCRMFYFRNRARLGTGCMGSGGMPVFNIGNPVVGNAAFSATLLANAAGYTSVLGVSTGIVNPAGLGCGLFLNPWSPTVYFPATTDALGMVNLPLPIPANPALFGAACHAQWAVLDPLGVPIGPVSLALTPLRTIIIQ